MNKQVNPPTKVPRILIKKTKNTIVLQNTFFQKGERFAFFVDKEENAADFMMGMSLGISLWRFDAKGKRPNDVSITSKIIADALFGVMPPELSKYPTSCFSIEFHEEPKKVYRLNFKSPMLIPTHGRSKQHNEHWNRMVARRELKCQ